MQIISSASKLKEHLRQEQRSIGFVPTMGALHEGHLTLIRESKKQNDITVVSIFVNPTQFLKGEDLDKYPRRDEADKKICEIAGVDYLFMPDAKEMYSEDEPKVQAPEVRGYILEGATRPGHFSGVLTVVMKLLNIVSPTHAYFGKKDAQQLFLIEQMVKSYFMDVQIVPVDTVRDSDGVAQSSRNVYLNEEERKQARKIPASLNLARNLVTQGILDTKKITEEIKQALAPLQVEYVAVVSRNFEYLKEVEIGNTVILVEVLVGSTRLLDNIWL